LVQGGPFGSQQGPTRGFYLFPKGKAQFKGPEDIPKRGVSRPGSQPGGPAFGSHWGHTNWAGPRAKGRQRLAGGATRVTPWGTESLPLVKAKENGGQKTSPPPFLGRPGPMVGFGHLCVPPQEKGGFIKTGKGPPGGQGH